MAGQRCTQHGWPQRQLVVMELPNSRQMQVYTTVSTSRQGQAPVTAAIAAPSSAGHSTASATLVKYARTCSSTRGRRRSPRSSSATAPSSGAECSARAAVSEYVTWEPDRVGK